MSSDAAPPRAGRRARPLLSVLVPAYEFAEGVRRILAALCARPDDRVEILISDDSEGEDVSRAVAPFVDGGRVALEYVRNRPGRGAVANWNGLLDRARGEYCLLLHHDECPESPAFVARVLEELASRSFPDVLVLGCAVVDRATGRATRCAPGWLRRLVVRSAPDYLFFRNVVGAPSVVVARRERYPRYDERLRWLVDVDAYVRMLPSARVAFTDAVVVTSAPRASGSITASLRSRLRDVHREELAVVREKHPRAAVLSLLAGTSAVARCARAAEAVAWGVLRGADRAWTRLGAHGAERRDPWSAAEAER